MVNAQPDAPKTLLIYPPITDPTSPYHSLAYPSRARKALDLLARGGAIRRA